MTALNHRLTKKGMVHNIYKHIFHFWVTNKPSLPSRFAAAEKQAP